MSVKINAKEFRVVCRLLKSSCCNLLDGNCLLLDVGETHTCVQLISKFHIFCNYFKRCVLPLDKELYSKLMDRTDYKTCACCNSLFYSSAKNKKYCDECAEKIKRKKSAERKRRQRERQRSLYITNRTMAPAFAGDVHYLKFSRWIQSITEFTVQSTVLFDESKALK